MVNRCLNPFSPDIMFLEKASFGRLTIISCQAVTIMYALVFNVSFLFLLLLFFLAFFIFLFSPFIFKVCTEGGNNIHNSRK